MSVPLDEGELAADRLFEAGAVAIEERDGGPGRIEFLAGFDRADLTAPFNAVAGRWPVTVVAAGDEAAWRDAWRRDARAVRAGRRIVVQPPWVEPIGGPGDIVVEVDPGRVFGSGSHPSTTLALAVLEDHLHAGDRFLDVGSGSGVLSIAAVSLGATEVIALDIDPEAVRITAENAARNGVADRVHVSSTALEDIPGRFPLVACNISYT
ncbi:MAG: 50S ribosomal protein L11 methyltransferase, partial [Acidimicrobiales bacterium]